jgi:hypothetical protein
MPRKKHPAKTMPGAEFDNFVEPSRVGRTVAYGNKTSRLRKIPRMRLKLNEKRGTIITGITESACKKAQLPPPQTNGQL